MAHDIFPFVNVFVVTNILTRNYHEFLYFFSLSQYILQSMKAKKLYFNYLEILIFNSLLKKILINSLFKYTIYIKYL